MDDFSPIVDDWGDSTKARIPNSIPREINKATLIDEITTHEASHMAFGLLLYKENLGFVPPRSILVNFEKMEGNFKGCVSPWFDKGELHKIEPWYKEEPQRMWGMIFYLLAGYSSYKVFFEDSEYFVSLLSENNTKLDYYRLEGLNIGTVQPRTDDFAKAVNLLTWLGIEGIGEKHNALKKAIDGIIAIMNEDAVKKSICFVRQLLINRIGEIIEGEEFSSLCEKLQDNMKGISLNNYIH